MTSVSIYKTKKRKINNAYLEEMLTYIKVGQIIEISSLIVDKNKLRKVSFLGRCIAFKKCKNNSFITLRNNIDGVGIENSYLIYAPSIISLEILHRPLKKKFQKAKLYFYQKKSNKVNTY